MAHRAIIYFKLHNFFAELERLRNPALAGRPILVGQAHGSSCIVVSASDEALESGILKGITIRHAKRLCPEAVVISANPGEYQAVFESVLEILSHYSPLLEPHKQDAAFMDVTAVRRIFGGPKKIATEAAASIESKTKLRVFAGIASNKLIAELACVSYEQRLGASREAFKPIVIPPGREQEFLARLPVESLPGVGDKTTRRLDELGVRTVGTLAKVPEKLLVKQFGAMGSRLYGYARGIDYSRVKAAFPPEVIIIEQTFSHPIAEPSALEPFLHLMAQKAADCLDQQGRSAQIITLCLVSEDNASAYYQITAKHPISSSYDIAAYAARIVKKSCQYNFSPVIAASLKLSGLICPEGIQLGFLEITERDRRLKLALRNIRERFGENSLRTASALIVGGRRGVLSRLTADLRCTGESYSQ